MNGVDDTSFMPRRRLSETAVKDEAAKSARLTTPHHVIRRPLLDYGCFLAERGWVVTSRAGRRFNEP